MSKSLLRSELEQRLEDIERENEYYTRNITNYEQSISKNRENYEYNLKIKDEIKSYLGVSGETDDKE